MKKQQAQKNTPAAYLLYTNSITTGLQSIPADTPAPPEELPH